MALFESILRENFNYMDSELVLEQEAEELGIEPTDDATDDPEYMDEAVTTFCEEMYKLDAAMYIVDVQLESAIFEGATSVEAVAENALTDFITRVKEKILELWHKFQDWITKVTMAFRAFVSTASGFISKNSGSIKKKAEKNVNAKKEDQYTYTGYEYRPLINGKLVDTSKELGKASMYKEILSENPDKDIQLEDIYAQMAGGDKAVTTVSELITHIQKVGRGAESVDKVPTVADVESWISFNKKGKETLQKLGAAKDNCKREFDKIIKTLKKDESKAKKDDRTEAASKIHQRVRMLSAISSTIGRMFSAEVNLHVEAYKALASRLRAINGLSDPEKNKDKKENASSSFASGFDSSLLGNAYDMI